MNITCLKKEMISIVFEHMKSYISDIIYDFNTLDEAYTDVNPKNFIWVIRENGTHLISKNEFDSDMCDRLNKYSGEKLFFEINMTFAGTEDDVFTMNLI